MGIYVRKSLKAGPFRFNLSKSGLGVSAGVPGFRVGTGPRGNYVNVGRNGVYYRASLNGPRTQKAGGHPRQHVAPLVASEPIMEDVTGASATELLPTGPGDLVDQLNEAARRIPLAPLAAIALVVLIVVLGVIGLVLLLPGVPTIAWLTLRDRSRRSVVAFFDVSGWPAAWFSDVVDVVTALSNANGVWRINAVGTVTGTHQYKVNAGASTLEKRTSMKLSMRAPRQLVTNIAVPSFICGRSSLHLLPDRVLLKDGSRFSDVSYRALHATTTGRRFIERGRIPGDAQQVDTTWRFVNVKGGPDRRFNNNRQLPVMQYAQIELTTLQGLHWVIDCSLVPPAMLLPDVLRAAP